MPTWLQEIEMLFNDNRILFLDARDVESMDGVSLVMNPPIKRGACMQIEKEWEFGGTRPLCFVEWKGEYRFYYKVSLGEERTALGMAVSSDGINWERPEPGVVEFSGSTKNNLADIGEFAVNEMCVFADPSGPDEYRFKAVALFPAFTSAPINTGPCALPRALTPKIA